MRFKCERILFFCLMVAPIATHNAAVAQEITLVTNVEQQPLVAATQRLVDALSFAGSPLDESLIAKLEAAQKLPDGRQSVKEIQKVLDPLCLLEVNISAESRVKVRRGRSPKSSCNRAGEPFWLKFITRPESTRS